MPTYHLYPLNPAGSPEAPEEMVAFNDAAAMRWALRRAFALGCDIFLDGRFVARVHGPQDVAGVPPTSPRS